MQSSTPMARKSSVWPLAISLAATLAIEFSFSSCRYLDVSVHDVPSITLWIHVIVTECFSAGFPHSDICGSSDICSLPQLFAAYHVLLRLLVPRHPPYALLRLIIPVQHFSFSLSVQHFRAELVKLLRNLRFVAFTPNCFLFEVILLSFQKIRLSTFFFDKIDSRTEHFLDLNSILISTHFLSLISRLSSVKDLSFTDLRLICNFQSTTSFCLSTFNWSGDNEIRTHDPLLARQVLSQLSYTPRWAQVDSNHRPRAYQARALTC